MIAALRLNPWAALQAWYLRRLIKAGEQSIRYCEQQLAANRADVGALRVRLAVLEAQQ